jgi:acetoin:2,6-dichlorophenolindophenol oxidoreductase subunit beta
MAELSYRDAVIRGISQEMRRDNNVVFLGEDIGKAGGVFKATVGLFEEFGPLRVRDTPISEQAILGAAMGAAMTGLRPIAEIMFSDFIAVCFDYIANEMPKISYMTNGQVKCPLVIRTGNGAGVRFGAQHSQSVENWTMMIPGLKVVAPSSQSALCHQGRSARWRDYRYAWHSQDFAQRQRLHNFSAGFNGAPRHGCSRNSGP